ncbi:YrhK family protein [Streptomyces sp. TP-A0874]|uniref:YrhK family protein n=1 Tax=Streptomyces sp. TP-A0874 TaxID=549819 RepID=UPI000853B5D7|nr:YrhK family protein [Streptomyces sp. TP-A0874]
MTRAGTPGQPGHRTGRREIVLRQRYEVVSIVNDLFVALWFIVGSVFFFYPSTTETGVWCFLFGSVELFIRPAIRLARHLHIQRVNPETPALTTASQDY